MTLAVRQVSPVYFEFLRDLAAGHLGNGRTCQMAYGKKSPHCLLVAEVVSQETEDKGLCPTLYHVD